MTGDNQPLNPQQALAGLLMGGDPAVARSVQQSQKTQHGSQYMQSQLSFTSTDDDYIPDLERWEHVPHQSIYDDAQKMNPEVMHTAGKKWGEISAGLGGALFGLNLSIQKALSDGFQGKLADAALDAAKKFVEQGTDVQEVIKSVGLRIETAAFGAEAVKRSVPPPPTAGTGAAAGSNTGDIASVLALIGAESPAAAVNGGRSEEDLYREAIRAMQTNYDPTYQPAGRGVPTFVPVDSPGGSGPVDTGWNGGNGHGGTGGSGSGAGGAGTNPEGTGGEQAGTGEQQSPTDAASTTSAGDSTNSGGGQGNQGISQGQQGTSTTAASANPSTAAGIGGGGFGGGGGGRGGFGGGAGGAGGSGSGGPGRSTTGVPGAGNPAAAAASAPGMGKPGTPGMGGMPMGAGAGARKNEDSESERKTPDYLVTDREEELLGPRERTVPQAIGADIPAAQSYPDSGEGRRG
ncbi:hypothetical protein [Nocardia wallacei]|uniref:hypothetical protein n=1 Tax=Nocardia wallacei TaxID=480035 RepID=UPI002454E7A7|nr:hypothetical protein [Nocardia wallacei]